MKKNFPSINVNGQKIIVNNASRGEFTNSKYGRMLESNEPDVYTDKMRMANNLDEIVQNQDNIQGSAAKHPRRDRIVQFDEGDVRIKVGNKMYTAKVQIGVWDDGTKVFYDILNIKDTGAVPSVSSFKTNNTGRNQPSVSDVSVSQNQAAVNTQNENSSTAEQQGTNPNLLTKEQREAVNRLARACGVKVEIVPTLPMKNGRGANGKYVKGERAIYLAEDADRPMFDIFSHEVTHYLRMVSPEAFSHYSRAVMETLVGENALEGENANETRARLVRQVREDYASAGQELGYADAMEELAADFTGRLIDSPEEAVRMINEAQSLNEQQKRNVIQRIIDAIDRFVKRIRAYIRNTGDNAAPEELTQLDRTRQALVELLAAGEQSTETVNKNGPDRYSFAGEGARTADRAALDRARQMERRGARPETIWEETGWGRGLDGKWRYEIDDSAMNYDAGGNINASDDMRRANELADKVTELSDEEYDELLRLLKETEDERNGRTLGDYLGHTKLFEAYPELNEVGVRMRRDLAPDEYGSYDPDTNTININASISARNQAATMVHEVQHAIQNREGFAEGASSEYWNARQSGAQWVQATERIQNEIDGLRALLEDDPNAEDADLIRGDIDELEDKLNSLAFELYQNTAGEIEAREAAIRRNMPAEERRRFFPESMRPNENAVFAEEGTSYSKNPSDSEVVSIKGQIQAHLDEINEMKPVAVLSYQQGQSTRQIRENVVRMFKQFGYKVDRQGFGIIDINEKQLNESLNYLQTEEEKAAIFTVPRVLKRGIMINERIDHKDRNYGTVTIAAPVTINGVDGVVGVVVKKVKGNRYKTHRILMPDGSAFTFSDNNKTEATTGKMASVSEGESLPITSVNNTVSQNGPAVNTQNENSEEKFSLKAPVEETKELVAVHNLSEDNLKGVLELGGFPMPSIAVTKASMGHSQFGDISVVFGKDTIDPQKNSGNRVYAGDAWTPTFPNVEYEASEEAQKRIRDKYYELYRKYGADAARPLYGYGNYLEDEMNRMGGVKGIFDREKDNTGMMRLFLMDSGKENPAPVTVSKTTRMSDGEIELYKLCIEKMGEETFNDMSARDGETPLEARRRWMNEHRNDLEGVLKEFFMNADVDEAQASTMAETQPPSYYVKMAIYARRYMRNGPEKTTVETDAAATAKALRDAVDKNEYETWLKKLFAGAQKRSGIRNGRAPYTAQGNRRSFGATHDEYNLDNIVRAMKREMEKGGSGALATPSALRGAATRELTSIEDIRRHKGQITEVSESEALGYRNDFSDRLGEICNKAQKDDRFITDFANVIIESLDGAKTWNTVEQRIRQYGDVYNINDALLTDIRELLSDMRKAPVRYFEAKPRRSVNFEEAVAIIAPDSMNEGLKEQVRQRNINLVEYPTGDEDARLRELNNLDDARFSLKRENGGNGDTHYKTRLGLERAVNRLERAQSEAARADTSEGTRLSLKKGDYDYTKPFAQQVDDWKQGLIPQNDSLVVGATPETFVKVGFNSLPMTINQTHVDYAVNGTRDKDHYIGEAMLKQLPQKLADPVAIITSQTQTGTSVVALLDFVHNGKTVIVPVTVDGHGRQNSLRIDSNAITSVFAKGNAITKLLSDAINGETSNKVGIYYLNAKKAPALLQGAGLQLPGGLFLNGGFIHSITDPGSPVKPKLKNVTQSQQFKRWFGDWEKTPHTASKVVNPDGTPKVVYHGTDAKFNVFDSTKGRSSMDIQGMFFSPWELDAQGYGENVGAYYLNIKNPAPEATAYRALNKFAGQNDAGIKAREYLERLGYDGVNNGDEEYIAFYPEQIKSATDNIGTFDPDNGDIRYSLKGGTDIFRADDAAANGYDGKTNGNGAQNEKNTLIEKINSAENVLADMDIVDTLTGAEFPKSEKGLVDQVTEFYSDAYNGKVTNPEIGEVRLSKQGVRSSIAHGLGRTKAITFAAVPSVIENGKIIEHTNNWKGRGYDTYIVAAPIEISEQRAIVGVVITSNKNSNDYYLHEVAIKDDVPFKTGRGNNALNSSDTSTSNINISQTASAVNTKNEKSEVWSQDRGLQLPKSADTITRSNSSILQKSDFVNTQNENTDDIRYSVKADMAKEGYDPEKISADEMIDWLIDKYGKVKQGENPARDVAVPKKTAANRPVSLFARTMMEAGITPDWAVSEFEQAIIDGTLTHEVITDDSARQRAEDTIKDKGFEEALRDWQTHSYENNINKNSFALGITLYNGAITEASEAFARGDEVAGREATRTAMKLAAELTVEATAAGQTLQATRMLKRMSPDGQLYYVEKSVQRLNKEFKERLGDKFKGIELDEAMMEEFFRAKDEESRSKAYDKICQNIADQIPATVGDKWNAWRYLSMLFNTHTHFRNIVGNATFYPAVKIKNFIDRIIEPAAELAGGIKKEERTQTFKPVSREIKDFTKKDFKEMESVIQGVNAKYALTSDIDSKRRIFRTGVLEALRRFNNGALEAEDMMFLKLHYTQSLGKAITARGYTAEFLNSGTKEAAKALDSVRAYAVREAQRATYRDANALASALTVISRRAANSKKISVRAAGAMMEGVMPFKKTPLNIVKQGALYSPLGLFDTARQIKSVLKGGKVTGADVIDSLSRAVTGTGIIALGMWLRSLGMAAGPGDDDEKKDRLDETIGEQDYALKIGDGTYTVDWAAPVSLPFFVGVTLGDYIENGEFTFADMVNALTRISEPMFELSVLQGISDTIKAASYAKSDPLTSVAGQMAESYVTQALPTLGGQIARSYDATRRKNYVDKNSSVPEFLQKFLQQSAKKIPGATKLLQPDIDMWGREKTYGDLPERLVENFVSPGYYEKIDPTELDSEIERLYEETGNNEAIPAEAAKKFTVDKKDIYLTAEEYTEYARTMGQKRYELALECIRSDEYKKADAAGKVKLLKKAYDKGRDYAKEKILEKREKAE